MFCTQCGANNEDSAAVCAQCGRPLQPAPLTGQVVAPASQASAVYVPNYLVFAILATVLCCLPTGIAAIVYAAQVNGKLQAGDIAGAQAASRNAKMWCWISFGVGLALTFIYILLVGAGMMRRMGH
jgi:Interferon-induced transmembrane protein/zinc-ribbon domain